MRSVHIARRNDNYITIVGRQSMSGKRIVIILLSFQTLGLIDGSVKHLKMFRRSKTYDGLKCKFSDIIFEVTVDNEVGCAAQCSRHPYCLSVFYHPHTGRCQGCYAREYMSVDYTSNEDSHFYQFAIFHGCFPDSSDHLLDGPFIASNHMTTEFCVRYCSAGNYMFAMTKIRYCICGNSRRNYARINGNLCLRACPGDSRYSCGAEGKGMLYSIKAADDV